MEEPKKIKTLIPTIINQPKKGKEGLAEDTMSDYWLHEDIMEEDND